MSSPAAASGASIPPITVMIMTLNEVNNIEAAIRSFPAGTKIVLYDSFSTDGTVEKARELGATVVQRKFDTWAQHQNWGAKNIDFGNPWVYYSDADEHMTPELWTEICNVVASTECNAFEVRRKDMFMGTWIKHSSFYPYWTARLYKPQNISWGRLVHVEHSVDGKVGRLKEHFIHYPFSKGVGAWFARHIEYARLEAQVTVQMRENPASLVHQNAGNKTRRLLKRIFYRLPFRPVIKFMVLYVFRGGFLDGRAGFHYATMQSVYEYMILLHKLELLRKRKNLSM